VKTHSNLVENLIKVLVHATEISNKQACVLIDLGKANHPSRFYV